MDQLSLFDLTPEASCIWTYCPMTALTEPLTKADRALVPDGVYAADIGGHRMILRPADKVPPGHEYCHWLAGGRLFSGIFIGEENT